MRKRRADHQVTTDDVMQHSPKLPKSESVELMDQLELRDSLHSQRSPQSRQSSLDSTGSLHSGTDCSRSNTLQVPSHHLPLSPVSLASPPVTPEPENLRRRKESGSSHGGSQHSIGENCTAELSIYLSIHIQHW